MNQQTVEQNGQTVETAPPKTLLGQYAENLLVGTLEAIVRAGSKALESLTHDASKAIAVQKKKVDTLQGKIRNWRETNVGEVNADLPEDLK